MDEAEQRGHSGSGEAQISLVAIAIAFFWLGVTSFGGGTAAWLYRAMVQRRHWIDDRSYLSGVALSRIMPGSGGVSLTVQVGQQLRGSAGAVVAVISLLSGPLVIVIALAAGFARIAGSILAHAVLDGVAAAAIGLTFATGLVLVPRGASQIGQIAIVVVTALTVGVLGWPLLPVVTCLAPLSIGLAFWHQRRHS